MYIHQCNMVRSIPSLKMASMPRRRMTIMVYSANANAPKNGDSIESSFLFPSSFIIPITSVYVQYFAYIFDLRLCIHCAHPSVLTAGPQRYTPQKHAIHAINPTSRIDYTLPKSLYPALKYRACALRFHAVHLTVALEIEFISGYANDDTVRLPCQSHGFHTISSLSRMILKHNSKFLRVRERSCYKMQYLLSIMV